jgi:hypothetical protein
MGLETGNYISDLIATNPPGTDPKSQGDDHLRLIKDVLKKTFPDANSAINFKQVSLAANGYAKLPGGLIVQWGTVTVTPGTATGNVSVTYPIAFPTAVVYRNVGRQGLIGASNSPSIDQIHKAGTVPLTTGDIQHVASAATSAIQMMWIAVGY